MPLTTLPKLRAKRWQSNRPPSAESENSKNVAKRQREKRNKRRKREQLPQRRPGEVEVQQEVELCVGEDWGGHRVCRLPRALRRLPVRRKQLDQRRQHQRDGQSAGLPVVPVLQPVGVVNLRLNTNRQLIPSCRKSHSYAFTPSHNHRTIHST